VDAISEMEKDRPHDLTEVFPEEIQTSIYMSQTNTDYRVVLRMPSLEYQIPSSNFLFMKTFTRSEARKFFKSLFSEWHKTAIKIVMQYHKFSDLVTKRGNGAQVS